MGVCVHVCMRVYTPASVRVVQNRHQGRRWKKSQENGDISKWLGFPSGEQSRRVL